MKTIVLAALAAAILLPAAAQPAAAMSKEQAVKECRAVANNRSAYIQRNRTGLSFQQQVARCVKAKMGG